MGMNIYLPENWFTTVTDGKKQSLDNAPITRLIKSLALDPQPLTDKPACGYYLTLIENQIVIQQDVPEPAIVKVDFTAGASAHRRKFGGGLGQDIAKALGITGQYRPSIVDTTAGLGRDTFVMATLGCDVIAIERNPGVAALLQDGLQRALYDPEASPIVQRIQFQHGTSREFLLACRHTFAADVIYIDPMFEHTGRQTAKVKKDMQAFRQLVGEDSDGDELLITALEKARCRVVVKRARKAAPLANKTPSYSISGKANRYDIYALRKVAAESAS